MIVETLTRNETLVAVGVATAVVIYISYRLTNGKKGSGKAPPSVKSPDKPELLHDFFLKKSYTLGPVMGFHAANQYVVVLNGREAIQEALVKRSLDFADHFPMYAELNVWNPQLRGLISKRYSDQYNKNRHTSMNILKEFGLGNPRALESRIVVELEDLVKRLEDLKSQPVYPKELISLFLLNVISGMLLAHKFEGVDATLRDFIAQASQFLTQLDPCLDLAPSVRSQSHYEKMIKEMSDIKTKLMGTVKVLLGVGLGKEDEDNFVKRYKEKMGEAYDDEELIYLVRDLANGGMQTTAIQLLWAVVQLGNNAEIQTRMRKEIDSVVPRDRFPSLDDRKGLPYVEACLLEMFRTRGLLPFVFPHCTACDTQVAGYDIPKNTMVMVNMHSIHMDERVWSHPEQFNPDRFLDSNGELKDKDKVVPFSLGKRSCPGEEMARQEFFLFVATLVQRFTILPPDGASKVKDEQVVVKFLTPAEYKVKFVPRK